MLILGVEITKVAGETGYPETYGTHIKFEKSGYKFELFGAETSSNLYVKGGGRTWAKVTTT